jgi:hypothetical protein
MTLRFSSELAADEGRVFLAYAPPRPLLVLGRRDPRNGELCVSRFYWKPPEALGLIPMIRGRPDTSTSPDRKPSACSTRSSTGLPTNHGSWSPAMTITDALLLLIVVGSVVLALAVDLAAILGWLRKRWGADEASDQDPADRRADHRGRDRSHHRPLAARRALDPRPALPARCTARAASRSRRRATPIYRLAITLSAGDVLTCHVAKIALKIHREGAKS